MSKYLKRNKFLKRNKNTSAGSNGSASLQAMRKRILWQAGLTTLVLVLTIVIVFAITAAWTTNIVQTSGLQFQAETWGFDREISVVMDAISASPGDEGAVQLEVKNDNQDMAAVSVNVSKADMDKEMQKRLFFYVDTQTTRNGEVMDRVYLNTQDSYTYVLLSGQNLSLTETSHNDAQLKWQWVYDVLGYYVLGTETEGGVVSEYEYLRPIEYKYDPATTEFAIDENGIPSELKSIGGQSVADFLKELSAHDGYKGEINAAEKLGGGYYPVDVDDNGYGIYAYLCSYGEIEAATVFDTALGTAAAKASAAGAAAEQYKAVLTISAENYRAIVEEVATLDAIKSAISEGNANVLQLSGDIIIAGGEMLEIPEGRQISLNLNGYTITGQTSGTLIEVNQGATLSVYDGKISGSADSTKVMQVSGAEVNLSNVDITGFKQGIYAVDSESSLGLDSKVHLMKCSVSTTGTAVMAWGNGTVSDAKTEIVIESCKISSNGIAISGNGTVSGAGNWGTDIQIIDSTVTSNAEYYGSGIYHPQKDSTLTVYNSTISGYTGIAIKGGSVSVVKSTVIGKGADQDPVFSDSGFADTGDGIYIETNYGYKILLEISEDSAIHSEYGLSLQVFDSKATHVDVKIYSGVFDEEQPDDYIAVGSVRNGNNVAVQQ